MQKLLAMCAPTLLLGLGACGQSTYVPISDIRPFQPITMSCKDTPQTRQQIVAHNSVYDTLKTGKKIVYKDDCEGTKPTS